jgi:hypothetical protein
MAQEYINPDPRVKNTANAISVRGVLAAGKSGAAATKGKDASDQGTSNGGL